MTSVAEAGMGAAVEPKVKERPIIFSASMVRALLDGRKTQTRRIVKQSPIAAGLNWSVWYSEKTKGQVGHEAFAKLHCPYGKPGDRLWVRETWQRCTGCNPVPGYLYRATCEHFPAHPWRPSIFMPRWASRITLELTAVRVQRLQDINPEEAIAEGTLFDSNGRHKLYGYALPVDDLWRMSPVDAYMHLWDSLHGPGAWAKNPFVWVLDFWRCDGQSA